ncbi:hypothetical protein F2Q69_00060802 [Brassica cretica]|uniref:Uncharacterized protein n=1 Tax=Brassica cretica TaxID=69181 RepID=A0A8S9RLR4_BRACR|nr:hypothetical protein F2Q69_00060802 [Brassica cretica]
MFGRRVPGGEGAACIFRCGVFREVEACSDPPSPALASGKGVSFRFVFAGFWLRRAEASKAPRCRLGTRCSFGLRLLGLICVKFGVVVVKSKEISRFVETLRRDDSAVKNGYGFVGGLSVTELRRTRILMVLFWRHRGRGGQVEAVTTRDALMEQIHVSSQPPRHAISDGVVQLLSLGRGSV